SCTERGGSRRAVGLSIMESVTFLHIEISSAVLDIARFARARSITLETQTIGLICGAPVRGTKNARTAVASHTTRWKQFFLRSTIWQNLSGGSCRSTRPIPLIAAAAQLSDIPVRLIIMNMNYVALNS